MNVHRVALLAVAALAGCGDGGGFPDAALPEGLPPGGTLSLQWTVTDAMGAAITCDSIRGQVVTLVLRGKGIAGGSTETFSCDSKTGTTPLVAAGTYDIQLELIGTTGQLATAPTQSNIVVNSNVNTPLAMAAFAVENTGNIDAKIDALAAGGNCAATTANGAGITGTTITLQRQVDGACKPLLLTVGAGATQPASTYMIDCTTPVEAGCIEKDQPITASGVTADQYQVHVRGKVNGVECYKNDDLVVVPPLLGTLMRTLNLGHLTTAGC